jgi:hypothetical protein
MAMDSDSVAPKTSAVNDWPPSIVVRTQGNEVGCGTPSSFEQVSTTEAAIRFFFFFEDATYTVTLETTARAGRWAMMTKRVDLPFGAPLVVSVVVGGAKDVEGDEASEVVGVEVEDKFFFVVVLIEAGDTVTYAPSLDEAWANILPEPRIWSDASKML